MHEIETNRLILRQFKDDDLEAYHLDIFNDPQVMRYLISTSSHPTRDSTRRQIARIRRDWQTNKFGLWAVIYKEHRKFIGHCGLTIIPDTDKIEVQYVFSSNYWGKGVATEAALATLRYGFEFLKIVEIAAVSFPENVLARRVLKKLGMHSRGEGWYYGTNLAYYTLHHSQFTPTEDDGYILRDVPSN
jgi:ribosomal-protein-alanine N-acetyltransferase